MITYIATNTLNGKFYIGSTTNFERRKKSHMDSELEYPFHRALRKNPEAFVWEVYPDDSEGRELEQALLDMWFGKEQCYNLSENASSPSTFRSEIHRKAIGDAHRGKVNSEETRKKISNSKKGKKFNDEYKRKRAEIQREVSNRPELKKQKAEKLRGQKRTPEQKEILKKAAKEAANRPEVKAKKSKALRGKPKSPESIAKSRRTRTGMKLRPRSEEQKQAIREKFKDPSIRAKMSESAKANKYYDPEHPEIGIHNAGNLVIKQKALGYPHGPENRVRVE
jgi:group I intron endonuclease